MAPIPPQAAHQSNTVPDVPHVDPTPTASAPAPAPSHSLTQNHEEHGAPHTTVPANEQQKGGFQAPFKERVIGAAKKTRGTLLGKPELKEDGAKIIAGETTAKELASQQ